MAERGGDEVAFHAYEVAPRKGSHVDAAGGTNEIVESTPMGKDKGMAEYQQEKLVAESHTSLSSAAADGEEPSEEDLATLRLVADKLPWSAFLVAIVELAERYTYYGCSGPFTNYISNPYPGVIDDTVSSNRADPNFVPGAIGLGSKGANGLYNFFQFWAYLTPIFGAIVADQYLGRYKTIVWFSFVYIAGLLILFLTSLPVAIENGAALGGLVTAMVVIGLGTGGIKSNVSTLIAEQYTNTKKVVKTLKSGERVIVDPAITVQRLYMMFYACINIGGLSPIATTEIERHVNFWPAYLMCLLTMMIAVVTIILGRKRYKTRPPTGSVVPNAFKVLWIGARSGWSIERAKPSYQASNGQRFATPWNDLFVDELRRALVACRVFLFFPIYWVVYNQMLSNFVVQAGELALHGIPNDLMSNIDPIAIIIFIPILDRLVYPAMRKMGIRFKPITRIFWGFVLAAGSMAYAAGLQKLIYDNPPNSVHVAIQTPAYVLIGLSEIFASITGLEYAYTKAPSSMKSFIMSLFLLQSAFGSALGIALTSVATYPKYMWMYIGLAIATIIAAGLFWLFFSRYNKDEDSMNAIEARGQQATNANDIQKRSQSQSQA